MGGLKPPQNFGPAYRIHVDLIVRAVRQIEHIPVLHAARKFRTRKCGQPSNNHSAMSILKYVTKQPSRKLKDHNMELPNADLPTLGVSSRACTTMPGAETSSSLPAQTKLPACTIVSHSDTSTPYAETGASPSSSASHLPSSLVSCLPARILPASPNQPRLKKFPLRQFGTQRRGFSATWYDIHPWLHYLEDEDVILCFYCATAVERKMPMTGYMDTIFSALGFYNWKKAVEKFSKHERSACHLHALMMITAAKTVGMDVGDKLSVDHAEQMALNRKCLLAIISSIQFLARQGLALSGTYTNSDDHLNGIRGEVDSNFMQLLLLRKQEVPGFDTWLQKSRDRFICPEIQNELLQIMGLSVLRKVAGRLAGQYYTIMADETTDISNTEQLVLCLRFVDDQLVSHEEFIGLHSMDDTTAERITRTIEDILLRLSLPLENCRGQCYDGASSMAGCKTGVSTNLLAKERRALYTHCYGHSLNLAVQEAIKGNKILQDTLDTVEEMAKLIKKSPRRQVIFEKVKNDIGLDVPGIRLLCPTRWTVRASALTSISENYEALVETWSQAKEVVSDSEMRARIGGVAKQMETFDFFFGVELGRIVLNMADNLSKALQGSSVSASDGQSLMKMTVATIQSIRSDESFTSFWQSVETKREHCSIQIGDPVLSRHRKVQKRFEVGTSVSEAQNSVEAKYRMVYYEVIDFTVSAIKRRFDQDGYKVLCKLEELLCDPKCKPNECNEIIDLYGKDFDIERLAIQLSVLHCNLPFEVHSQTGGMK